MKEKKNGIPVWCHRAMNNSAHAAIRCVHGTCALWDRHNNQCSDLTANEEQEHIALVLGDIHRAIIGAHYE